MNAVDQTDRQTDDHGSTGSVPTSFVLGADGLARSVLLCACVQPGSLAAYSRSFGVARRVLVDRFESSVRAESLALVCAHGFRVVQSGSRWVAAHAEGAIGAEGRETRGVDCSWLVTDDLACMSVVM